MELPISIIIPTFNEERCLPRLLKSIRTQKNKPEEVIVVDAYSQDKTVQIAKKFGCKVILDEGWISDARNLGAKKSTQPILLFLDSDVVLPKGFLEKCCSEMSQKNLDIASCFLKPLSNKKRDIIIHEFANIYFRFTKEFYPYIPGFCIFVKKGVHRKIKGFDTSLVLAEDHDYVRRAKKSGAKFEYLRSYKIPVSVRRLAEEGRLKLVLKYLAVEIHLLFIGKIKRNFFSYKFGQHYLN